MTRVDENNSAQQAQRADEQRRMQQADQKKRTDGQAFQKAMTQTKQQSTTQQRGQNERQGAQNMLLARSGISSQHLTAKLQGEGQKSVERNKQDQVSRQDQYKDTERTQNDKETKADSQRLDAQDDKLASVSGEARRGKQDMTDMSGGGGGGSMDHGGDLGGGAAPQGPQALQGTAAPQQAQGANAPRIPPQLIKEIVDRVFVGVNQEGLKEMRIELKGDTFGGTSINISNDNGKISARFETNDVNLGRLLKASEGELSRAFAHKGMNLERLEVTAR